MSPSITLTTFAKVFIPSKEKVHVNKFMNSLNLPIELIYLIREFMFGKSITN